MNQNSQIIKIGNSSVKLTSPTEPKGVILLLPGISGGILSGKFLNLEAAIVKEGYSFVGVEIWKDLDDLESMTVDEVFKKLDFVVNHLKKEGYKIVMGIGKSFGATIFLLYENDAINKKILIAPVISIEEENNIEKNKQIKLKALSSLMDLKINDAFLKMKQYPILIIHGKDDAVISIKNSDRLSHQLPNACLVSIEKADHTFKDEDSEKGLIDAVISFVLGK